MLKTHPSIKPMILILGPKYDGTSENHFDSLSINNKLLNHTPLPIAFTLILTI